MLLVLGCIEADSCEGILLLQHIFQALQDLRTLKHQFLTCSVHFSESLQVESAKATNPAPAGFAQPPRRRRFPDLISSEAARSEPRVPLTGSKIRNPVRVRIRNIFEKLISNLFEILIFQKYHILPKYKNKV